MNFIIKEEEKNEDYLKVDFISNSAILDLIKSNNFELKSNDFQKLLQNVNKQYPDLNINTINQIEYFIYIILIIFRQIYLN